MLNIQDEWRYEILVKKTPSSDGVNILVGLF
jgi:hypothetical protein